MSAAASCHWPSSANTFARLPFTGAKASALCLARSPSPASSPSPSPPSPEKRSSSADKLVRYWRSASGSLPCRQNATARSFRSATAAGCRGPPAEVTRCRALRSKGSASWKSPSRHSSLALAHNTRPSSSEAEQIIAFLLPRPACRHAEVQGRRPSSAAQAPKAAPPKARCRAAAGDDRGFRSIRPACGRAAKARPDVRPPTNRACRCTTDGCIIGAAEAIVGRQRWAVEARRGASV
mmetsp:Transcript_88637/g.286279  ORF Transcript_88637/g.286279 Transcript_88637/m.286279 type:complete len:237 (-) Transcript_88637:7-717(-)